MHEATVTDHLLEADTMSTTTDVDLHHLVDGAREEATENDRQADDPPWMVTMIEDTTDAHHQENMDPLLEDTTWILMMLVALLLRLAAMLNRIHLVVIPMADLEALLAMDTAVGMVVTTIVDTRSPTRWRESVKRLWKQHKVG